MPVVPSCPCPVTRPKGGPEVIAWSFCHRRDWGRSTLLLVVLVMSAGRFLEAEDGMSRPPMDPAEDPPRMELVKSVVAAGSASGSWTLTEVKRRAKLANRSFLDARNRVLRTRLGVQVAWSEVFAPKLTAGYTATNGADDAGTARVGIAATGLGFDIEPYVRLGYDREGRLAPDGSPTTDAAYVSATGLIISRQLFRISEALRKRLPVTEAERDLYVAANDLVIRGRELDLQATSAFLDVQLAEERRAVRRRRFDDAKSFAAYVEDRQKSGFASDIDGLNAVQDVNQAEVDLLADEVTLAAARRRLNDLLDLPLTAPGEILPENLVAAGTALVPPDLAHDLTLVLTDHESIGSRTRDIELAIDRQRIARDDLMPQVLATASAERRAFGGRPGDNSDGLDTVAALGLSYSVPLDGWRGERARYRQAGIQVEDLERSLVGTRNDLESRLRDLHLRLGQIRKGLPLTENRLEIERRRLKVQLGLFEKGSVDNLEVVRAKQNVDNAELTLLQLRSSLLTTDAEYRSLVPLPPGPAGAEE